jgi:hypothetical protein
MDTSTSGRCIPPFLSAIELPRLLAGNPEFNLHGNRFVILPEDLIERPDSYDEGFIESVQKDLEKDLKAIGACEITHTGNLD